MIFLNSFSSWDRICVHAKVKRMNVRNGAVLVTGGAGYIGSHAALALLDRGEKVVVIDDLSESDETHVPKGAIFVKGSVGDAALVSQIVREHDVEAAMHFAGFIRVGESVENPQKYFNNNTENTRIFAEALVANGVQKMIFSSSAAVYGNPSRVPAQEDDATVPINPYGESKLRAEKILIGMGQLQVGILRYFNVAGVDSAGRAGYRREASPTHMIRSCVRASLEDRKFVINGSEFPTADGTCVRDYIHVSDLADAHLKILDHLRSGATTRIYNCGDGHGYSNLEVVHAVGRVTGKDLKQTFGPPREGDPATLIADTSRIKNELGWSPRASLEDMIRDEFAWVRAGQVV